MKNTNLPFDPSQFVRFTIEWKKFLLFGKTTAESRLLYSGKWKFVGPKKYAKELADAKRASEDAQLTAVVSETAGKEMHAKVINAALRIDPNLKKLARTVRVTSAKKLAALNGQSKVLAVEIDETQKVQSAAELLLME